MEQETTDSHEETNSFMKDEDKDEMVNNEPKESTGGTGVDVTESDNDKDQYNDVKKIGAKVQFNLESSGSGGPKNPGAGGGGGGGDTVIHPRYNLHSNHNQSYEHQYEPSNYETQNKTQNEEVVLMSDGYIHMETPQMTIQKGLKVFGKGGASAIKTDMQQCMING